MPGLLREHLTAMDMAVGTFVHEKSEGLDEYLTTMGVPWMLRKVLANTSPTIEIVREGDQWNMTFKVDSFSVARDVISLLFGINLNKIKIS